MINYPLDLPEGVRVCFGKHWEARAIQCAGGSDPAYCDVNGSNQRERCAWYAKCASETVRENMAARPLEQQQVRPPMQVPMQTQQNPIHSILRGVAQGTGSALMRHLTQQTQQMAPPVPVQQHMVPQAHYGYPAQVMVQPAMASVPYMVPMNYQAPGMQMPGYLSVPEPPMEGQHWLTRLLLNIGRSMVKAGAHTTANFIDHTPVNPYPVYHPQGQGQGQ